MSQGKSNTHLHLPALLVEGFQGIGYLSIPQFGRVTLLAGKNGIGKTTVLDAIRVYAARGRLMVLTGLLDNREEFISSIDEDGDEMLSPDVEALFHGRGSMGNNVLSIGSCNQTDRLSVEVSTMEKSSGDAQRARILDTSMNEWTTTLRVTFKNKEWFLPWEALLVEPDFSRFRMRRMQKRLFDEQDEWPSTIECESLGPGLPSNTDMVRFWDRIALTDSESLPVQALQLILGNTVNRVAVIGDDGPRVGKTGRRIIVRLPGDPTPVPLKSLGDGAIRLFGVALALANSRNGFLLIDEAENGIHYSVQSDFWRMILQTAHKDNVQVIATTHSWDCVKGFARAATEFEDAEGVLVRLERDDDGMRAIEYSDKELRIAAEQGIEVR